MKINRLFEILYILIDKKTVPAHYLAEHFEVSVRTIYRDIDTLADSGIPIYTKKGKNGGIYILEDYIFDKSLLSDREQNDLMIGLQSLKAAKYPEIDEMLSKFSAIFSKPSNEWIEIDFSHWGSNNDYKNQFLLIKTAILNKNKIKFDYFNSYGEQNNRTIEPLQILFKSKHWYIYGFCRLKNDFRLFKLSRITNLILLNEHFDRNLNKENSKILKIDRSQKIPIILKIENFMSYRVFDEFHPNSIKTNSDGSFTVTVSYPEDEWLYGYILSFGMYAEIIEPLHIKNIIKQRLEKTLKKYL